jgi:hypothetical protein
MVINGEFWRDMNGWLQHQLDIFVEERGKQKLSPQAFNF